jgi:hypothetical protein
LYGGNVLAKLTWVAYFPSYSTGIDFSVKRTFATACSQSQILPLLPSFNPCQFVKTIVLHPVCMYNIVVLNCTLLVEGQVFLFITVLSPALGLTELISIEYKDAFCGVNWLEHEPDYSPSSAV